MNSITRTSSRRSVMKWGAALGAAAALPGVGGFRGYPALAQDDAVWETEPDMALAAEQAQEIVTYGMPDDWANYGEVFKGFQASLGVTDGKHIDTDMSSLARDHEIRCRESEPGRDVRRHRHALGQDRRRSAVSFRHICRPPRNNCRKAIRGRPAGGSRHLPAFPSFVVNIDALGGAEVPQTWADLLREDLKGKVGSPGDPRSSGTAQTTFLAWAYANGGDAANLEPGHRVREADHPAIQRGRCLH